MIARAFMTLILAGCVALALAVAATVTVPLYLEMVRSALGGAGP